MAARKCLVVGKFYWVIRTAVVTVPGDWQDEIQPARFDGWSPDGQMRWNFMGVDGASTLTVRWIGAGFEVPITPSRLRPDYVQC